MVSFHSLLIKSKSFSLRLTNWTEIKMGLMRGNQSDNVEELIGGRRRRRSRILDETRGSWRGGGDEMNSHSVKIISYFELKQRVFLLHDLALSKVKAVHVSTDFALAALTSWPSAGRCRP